MTCGGFRSLDSPRVLVASDHAAFIGVITNLVLGLILTITADRGEDTGMLGQIGFWVMDLGSSSSSSG